MSRDPVPELDQPGVPVPPVIRWKCQNEEFHKWIDWDWSEWMDSVCEARKKRC